MKKELEDILKEKFEGFEEAAGLDLFDKIIKKRSKRKAVIWLHWSKWTAAILLLLFVGTYSFNRWIGDDSETSSSEQIKASELVHKDHKTLGENKRSTPQDAPTLATEITEGPSSIVPGAQIDHATSSHAVQQRDQTTQETTEAYSEAAESEGMIPALDELEGQVAEAPEQLIESVNEITVEKTEETQETEEVIAMDEDEAFDIAQEDSESEDKEDIIFRPRRNSKFSLDVTVGPGYASRLYAGDTESKGYRRNTESPSMSYTAAVALNYTINRYWNIGLGVDCWRRNEIFNFEQHILSFDTTIVGMDTSINKNIEKIDHSDRNAYTRISVPLSIERNIYRSNEWSFGLKAGMVYTLYQLQSGTARVTDVDLVDLSQLDYSKNSGFAASLGLNARYRINRKVEFLFSPAFSMDLSEQSTGITGLNKREFNAYAKVGFRFGL